MILIDKVLVTDGVLSSNFACNLQACKGACCVEGDAGAPLEHHEAQWLEAHLPDLEPFLSPQGVEAITEQGAFIQNEDNELETPLLNGGMCAYAVIDAQSGIVGCGIERAYFAGAVDFRKPISCHLYPIRIETQQGRDILHYHRWNICKAACVKGREEQIPLYQFLEEALVRKYGRTFYALLQTIVEGQYTETDSQQEPHSAA